MVCRLLLCLTRRVLGTFHMTLVVPSGSLCNGLGPLTQGVAEPGFKLGSHSTGWVLLLSRTLLNTGILRAIARVKGWCYYSSSVCTDHCACWWL